AMVAVRLSEISPDDKASRITYGLLNLTHRDSQENPEPLKEGKRYVVKLALNEIAQTINRGHRLRIAISTSYFPVAWATPEPVCLTIYTGISKLQLPVLPKEACHKANKVFQEPVVGPYGTTRQLEKPERGWFIKRNMMNEVSTVEILNDEGKVHHEEIGLDVATKTVEKYSYQYDDHDSLRGETRCEMLFERPDWKVETITNTVLTSSKHRFLIRATLDAYLNGARVFSKSWDEKIPRKLL
ncbi:MAG: CocE/NonD family hydrolase C-terminal non-catalytic domain-containing protein, partial [Candidatus Rifleibacteriota bacterium]